MVDQLHITRRSRLRPYVRRVRNEPMWVKPRRGGFWTSSYLDGKSEWVDAHQDMFVASRGSAWGLHWFLLTVDPAARILQVDSMRDLRNVLDRYPNKTILGGWSSSSVTFVRPDFEAIARDYDAMHLTERGQWATRLTYPCDLYGWDSESTLWFRWKFTSVRLLDESEKAVCEREEEA